MGYGFESYCCLQGVEGEMTDPLQHLPEGAKIAGDIVSAATVIGTLAQWLPYVAALLSIVWTILRIYDWVEARRDKRRL